jgi:hypothetical protein
VCAHTHLVLGGNGEVAEGAGGELLQTRVLDEEQLTEQLGSARIHQLDAVLI